jgi:hypothetical protein
VYFPFNSPKENLKSQIFTYISMLYISCSIVVCNVFGIYFGPKIDRIKKAPFFPVMIEFFSADRFK